MNDYDRGFGDGSEAATLYERARLHLLIEHANYQVLHALGGRLNSDDLRLIHEAEHEEETR